MIKVTVEEWKGLEGLSEGLLEEIRPQVNFTMKQALVRFEAIIKETLTGARSGRTYRVSRTGHLHVASAPGEPPAVLFGNLRNSVGHRGPRWEGWAVVGEVGPGLGQAPSGADPDPSKTYARRLEFGGIDSRGVMIEARPYMAPSAEKAEPIINEMVRRELGS